MSAAATDLLSRLLTADGPAIGITTGSAPSLFGTGAVARRVDGETMRTVDGVIAALAAAWDFPDHFGGNKDALDDSMRDLPTDLFTADGAPATAYVTVVEHADALLADAPDDDLDWFADSADFWRDHHRRDGRGFAVVLVSDAAASLRDRWRAAGADLAGED